MEAVWSYLEEAHRRFPEREAVVFGDTRWTYATLYRRSLGLANQMSAMGVGAGDRVALLWENSAEYLRIYFAVQKLGAVLVGLNPVIDARYLDKVFGDCAPKLLVAQVKFARRFSADLNAATSPPAWLVDAEGLELPAGADCELIEDDELSELECPLPGYEDNSLILYTSGTTGQPKGVTLSQHNLIANTDSIAEYLELDETERVMVLLPFYYSYGHSLLLTHVAVGGCLVIDNRLAFPNNVLDTMERERVTGLPGVAATFTIFMTRSNLAERSIPSLRYFTTAGGALPPAGLKRLRGLLPTARPIIMYGQTEGTARLSYLPAAEVDVKPGSIGRGIPGVKLEVLDDEGRPTAPDVTGEIVASGENIMKGYWGDPEETSNVLDEQRRLWTGDLARIDRDGYIYVVGRKKDMIKSGAFRINPKEIEDLAAELAGVVQCAVIGVEDELLGEKMVACIIQEFEERLEIKEVKMHFRKLLPHWKQPQEILFMSDFPRTSSGKVRKHLLKESYLATI
ncbi:MAG: acyl--CoA ligase [bacterium]|nr:acyl--CoA ligase [bacterium]